MPAGYSTAYRAGAKGYLPRTYVGPGYKPAVYRPPPTPANENLPGGGKGPPGGPRLPKLPRSGLGFLAGFGLGWELGNAYLDFSEHWEDEARRAAERQARKDAAFTRVGWAFDPAHGGYQIVTTPCDGGGGSGPRYDGFTSPTPGPGECKFFLNPALHPLFGPGSLPLDMPIGRFWSFWVPGEATGEFAGPYPIHQFATNYAAPVRPGETYPPSPDRPIVRPFVVPWEPTTTDTNHADPQAEPARKPEPQAWVWPDLNARTPTRGQVPGRAPPKKKEKERKIRPKGSKGLIAVIKGFNEYTELVDVLSALYDSIEPACKEPFAKELEPKRKWDDNHIVKSGKNKGRKGGYVWDRPSEGKVVTTMGEAVYKCLGSIDMDTAVFNLVWQQLIEDFVYSKIGLTTKELSRPYASNIGHNRGETSKAQGKKAAELMKQAEAYARDQFESWTGFTLI